MTQILELVANVTEHNFPHDPSSVGEWEWKLIHFGYKKSTLDAVTAAEVDDWVVGKLPHLLAFKAQYPEEQRRIVALGYPCPGRPRNVSRLWRGIIEPALNRNLWCEGWSSDYHFLVVRKKV